MNPELDFVRERAELLQLQRVPDRAHTALFEDDDVYVLAERSETFVATRDTGIDCPSLAVAQIVYYPEEPVRLPRQSWIERIASQEEVLADLHKIRNRFPVHKPDYRLGVELHLGPWQTVEVRIEQGSMEWEGTRVLVDALCPEYFNFQSAAMALMAHASGKQHTDPLVRARFALSQHTYPLNTENRTDPDVVTPFDLVTATRPA